MSVKNVFLIKKIGCTVSYVALPLSVLVILFHLVEERTVTFSGGKHNNIVEVSHLKTFLKNSENLP